jgi:hypothetical protein
MLECGGRYKIQTGVGEKEAGQRAAALVFKAESQAGWMQCGG